MKTNRSFNPLAIKALATLAFFTAINASLASTATELVDDFSDPELNSLGINRMYMDDTTAGGTTSTEHTVADGILSATGKITPPRGQPGWASTILLLNPQGSPVDASAFEGIRLLIRINKGNISVSASSSDVTNYDYHAASVAHQSDGKFHEIKIPFASMKRVWSEQTSLNTKAITGISLVAFGLQPGSFDFEVKEVTFY